jgi:hypothetical protein
MKENIHKKNILDEYLDFLNNEQAMSAAGIGGWESAHYGRKPFKEKMFKIKKGKKRLDIKEA